MRDVRGGAEVGYVHVARQCRHPHVDHALKQPLLAIRDILVWIRIQLRNLLLSSVTLRMQRNFFHIFFL
jgi:hypothetical protein